MAKTGKAIKVVLFIELAVLTAVSLLLLALTIILLFAVGYGFYLMPDTAESIGRMAAVAIAFGVGCFALAQCVRAWLELYSVTVKPQPQETQRQGKQPEFGENGQEGKASKFDESQKWEIQHGRDFGLSEEQIALYARPELSNKQMYYIRQGLENGLPVEQVKLYAKPEFSAMQMSEIWLGCGRDVSLEQIASYAKPELTPLQIQELRRQANLKKYGGGQNA